jgi:hypothetical protein
VAQFFEASARPLKYDVRAFHGNSEKFLRLSVRHISRRARESPVSLFFRCLKRTIDFCITQYFQTSEVHPVLPIWEKEVLSSASQRIVAYCGISQQPFHLFSYLSPYTATLSPLVRSRS